MTRCEVKRCRKEAALTWLGHQVCDDHWSNNCDEKNKFDLYEEFGIAKPKMTPQLKAEFSIPEFEDEDVI